MIFLHAVLCHVRLTAISSGDFFITVDPFVKILMQSCTTTLGLDI